MKKGKKTFASIIAASAFAVCTGLSLLSVTLTSVLAYYEINETTYYTITVDGHTYKCYKITGEDSVAIAWLWSDDNPVPSTLNVPETVTIDETPFTVKSVAKGGFRYCTFTTINLPKTVTEIREEAFAYCENLETFTFPHGLTEIAPSTFLDCRSLTTLFYTNLDGSGNQVRVLGNNTIKTIGDHAFDSCVSLSNFYCPSSVTKFEQSCFQNCTSITKFYFPSDNMAVGDARNTLTIESYAFADCSNLSTVYFEENMTDIDAYAFVNCNPSLQFTYTGAVEPTYTAHWRDINLTTSNDNVYPFLPMGQSKIVQSSEYPGIIYSVITGPINLDCTNTVTYQLEANSTYIRIDQFDTPFASQAGYYDVATGTLTIPETIDGKPVKVIKQSAFNGHTDLRSIIFSANLVQIQHWAFSGCTSIASLNFNACTSLKEISYEVFQSIGNTNMYQDKPPVGNQVYNENLHSITLPNCLEFIGDAAFYNFPKLYDGISFKTDPSSPSQLKVIGDFAFAVFRDTTAYSSQPKLISIELPNSLNDTYAPLTAFYHPFQPWLNGISKNTGPRINRYAVGRYVFDNADYIGTVTMEPTTSAQDADNTHTTSLASNVFVRCGNLVRFESNKKLFLVGSDTFKDVTSMREVFLHSEYAQAGSFNFPWGVSDCTSNYQASPFAGMKNAVIYVSGSAAPKNLGNPDSYSNSGVANMWNTDSSATYDNEFENSSSAGSSNNRSHIPTFYNIDWDSGNSIKYWQTGTNNTPTYTYKDGHPSSPADYNSGLVAIVKDTSNHYTVAKYFTDGSHAIDYLNLTELDIASSINTIGEFAFATENAKAGYYFVLPDTITKIGERAFYRKTSNSVRIVTYKSGGTITAPASTTYPSQTFETIKSQYNGTTKPGYCCLPANTTVIERNAFYNNTFSSISLSANLSFLGSSAFVTYAHAGKIIDVSFTPSNTSSFTCTSGAIYYTGDANKKALLYYASGSTSTLSIAAGTKAVGFRALAKSQCSEVTIPTGLTHIYGGAFQGSALTTVSGAGLASIKYISARNAEEIFDSTARTMTELYNSTYNTLPFDYYDCRDVGGKRSEALKTIYNMATNSAFKKCTSLVNMDFTQMTSLVKIGSEAFNGCSSLSNMAGGETYNFYLVTSNASSPYYTISNQDVNKTTGVLDLSGCSNLISLYPSAFAGCSGVHYAITPNTTGSNHDTESDFYYGRDNTTDYIAADGGMVFPKETKVLFGESYKQAYYQQNANSRSTHYPAKSFDATNGHYYFRYFYEDSGTPITDGSSYNTNVTDNTISGTYESSTWYWSEFNGNYYLFQGRTGAQAFYTFVKTTSV